MRAIAVVLLVVAGLQEKKQPRYKDVERMLPAYFASAPGKPREAILEKMRKAGLDGIVLTKAEAQAVERMALAGNPMLATRKGGDYTIQVDVGRKADVHVHVPGGWKPQTPAPLVIALHGGSAETTTAQGSSKAGRDEMSYWSGACDSIKAFCVGPSTTGFWSDKAGLEAIWKSIEHARDNFNIDPNRIAVVGHSMGGFGIFDFGPDHADRFALAAPFVGGADATSKLKNCRALPFYIVIGTNDPMKYINEACRKNAKFLEDLKYDVTFRERTDQGHDVIADEFPAVMAKLQKSPRDLYARKLTRVRGAGRWYWVESDGAVEAAIEKNTITIEGSAGAVYVSDRMLDLDQPVKVVAGGETKFEGKVERKLAFMLAHLDETGDRGRVFANRVELK